MARNTGDKNRTEREKIKDAQRKADKKKFAARQLKDQAKIATLKAKCDKKDVEIRKLKAKLKKKKTT